MRKAYKVDELKQYQIFEGMNFDMEAKGITPILNVSDIEQSFEWFGKLGWSRNWDWGDPVDFGCVGSGECEIFLCLNGQGERGVGDNTATFGEQGGETRHKGVWMSIWVEDIDKVHEMALEAEIVEQGEDDVREGSGVVIGGCRCDRQ